MAYRFIETHEKEFGLRWLLRRMKIYPNAYYNYLKRRKAEYCKKKEEVCHEIKEIYHEFGGILGYRSMRVFLSRKGIELSNATVHKYMNRQLQLYCICRRRKPKYRRGQVHKVFPNRLNQEFYAQKANQVWCIDFTYLFLSNGAVRFNCSIIDLYDRSVIASENGKWITSELAIQTVKKALSSTGHSGKGLILHSDQGRQYTSSEFMAFCQEHGIIQSMSSAGCPYDNAAMERYYNTLKSELINQYQFKTDTELNHAVQEFAYHWYNQVRPHSYNNYLTPFQKRFALR